MEYVLIKTLNELLDSSSESKESSTSSSSEDEIVIVAKDVKEKPIKNQNYDSLLSNHYIDSDFQSHFRITRTSLQILMENIKFDEIYTLGRPRLLLKDSLLLTVWALSNQESFRSIGERFRLSRGNAYKIFTQTCRLIANQIKKYVTWPLGDDAVRTVNEFKLLMGNGSLSGVLGCVDGIHIPIQEPLHDTSFYNRNGFHSIIVQGICNARLEFINISCGWPGSIDVATVWENCSVYRSLSSNPSQLLLPNTYLLGNSAYPLRKFLLVPFKDYSLLTNDQKIFNNKLNSTRVIIERAFEKMKNQFRRLKFINVSKLENATSIVTSACILHNISVRDGTEYLPMEEDQYDTMGIEEVNSDDIDDEALSFRDQIMDSIISNR